MLATRMDTINRSNRAVTLVLASALTCLAICVGCAAPARMISPATTDQVKPDQNHALVYVYRVGIVAFLFTKDVKVNDEQIGKIKTNQYILFMAPPGLLRMDVGGRKLGTIVNAGGIYFAKLELNTLGADSFQIVSEQTGRNEISLMESVVSLERIPVIGTTQALEPAETPRTHIAPSNYSSPGPVFEEPTPTR